MDYKALLTKYMQLVIDEEGVSYLEKVTVGEPTIGGTARFTQQEIDALREIEKSARPAAGY